MIGLAQLRADREQIANVLRELESGRLTTQEPDERGELNQDSSDERMASLRRQLAQIDRQIAQRAADNP